MLFKNVFNQISKNHFSFGNRTYNKKDTSCPSPYTLFAGTHIAQYCGICCASVEWTPWLSFCCRCCNHAPALIAQCLFLGTLGHPCVHNHCAFGHAWVLSSSNKACNCCLIYCIPEYRDFSTAEIGWHRLMNIFLIFFSLVPKINRHGLMLCHVMPIRFWEIWIMQLGDVH